MRWALAAIATVGCYAPTAAPGAPCGANDACPSNLVCLGGRCELPGTQMPDAAMRPDATPVCVCAGNDLSCDGTPTACAAGCSSRGEPHCLPFTLLNDVAFDLANGTDSVSFNTVYDVDVDTGEIKERVGATVLRAAGTGIAAGIHYSQVGATAVFAMTGLSMNQNAELRLTGTRPTIFVVDGEVEVRGVIDASGGCINGGKVCGGPGGGDGANGGVGTAAGCGPGGAGTTADGSTVPHSFGGGGGGFGTAGSPGAGAADTEGPAGPVCTNTLLVPLIGGSGGGRGGNVTAPAVTGGNGGGGGGAIQISASGSITITGGGVIDVGGAGGKGDPGTTAGAGGGGSGGGVLLQASSVTVSATIAANGGGGGGHNTSGDGTDGTRDATPAPGFGTNALYKGGAGGAGTIAPAGVGTAHGGGGGGAVGVVRILATQLDLTAGTISPPPATGTP